MKTTWVICAVAVGSAVSPAFAQPTPPAAPAPVQLWTPTVQMPAADPPRPLFPTLEEKKPQEEKKPSQPPASPQPAPPKGSPPGNSCTDQQPCPGPDCHAGLGPMPPGECCLPYDVKNGPDGCCACLTWDPQMIGDSLSIVQSLQGSLANASKGVTFATTPLPAGVTATGNVLHASPGFTLLVEGNQAVLHNNATGTATAVPLPAGTLPIQTKTGVLAVKVTQTPLERGPLKISENESPRPMDRVFGTYNYYSNADGSHIRVSRQVIGFEKTFLDGEASLEVRGPGFQMDGDDVNVRGGIGDVIAVLKFALADDPETGNLISAGVLASAPTGKEFTAYNGATKHSPYVQPYLGYIYNNGYWYVQGFSSVALPVDFEQSLVILNDIGVGYYLWLSNQESILEFVVPTVEVHVNTPVTKRERSDPFYAIDEVNITFGVHVGLGAHAVFTVGGSVPVLTPKPFDSEFIGQLNIRF